MVQTLNVPWHSAEQMGYGIGKSAWSLCGQQRCRLACSSILSGSLLCSPLISLVLISSTNCTKPMVLIRILAYRTPSQIRFLTIMRGRGGLVVNTSDSGSRGRGFEPHSGRRVVSLSKTYLLPKSTGNTQKAVAPSQHD